MRSGMRRVVVRSAFTAVRTEGGILPADLLERVAGGDKDVPGLAPESYHLGPHERLGEAVNRSWSRLRGAWASFNDARAKLPEGDPATRVTRERWLLPLFQELGYGRLLRSNALEVDGKSFAVSHLWHRSPLHLLGAGLTLDRRAPGVAGAAMASPHGMVQELLNRSDDLLWGMVSNGLTLRVLRDHHSLTRQAYVELDLESIMEGEQYSEFLLLWLVCHQSRVEAEKPEECWLERWFQLSRDEGVRALDKLRDGVQTAIEKLGQGFLRHRGNGGLQEALEKGELDGQEYYRELLRLVYRLIFLFVAEDREALLDPAATDEAKDRYLRFYATRHLRRLAERSRGGPHGDLWQGLRLVMEKLGEGCPELALPALGSFLWRQEAMPHLAGCELANGDLLESLRVLGTIEDRGSRYPVNWRNVGSEELGSIYESLLELHPRLDREAGTFELATAAGHERKTTGSYYTPASLVECLLDSALDPVLDEAASKADPERAILDLKVCDPACGSGHFLVAAARRIANRLAAVRSRDEEPAPEAVQHALRDVVGRCLYGVDVNPMAVELCKVSLWMEAVEPGKPLSFLDHHIQCGNSILGVTPELLEKGIPDDAFKPIEGDDRAFCRELKKYNVEARDTRQQTLFDQRGEPWMRLGDLAIELLELDSISDADPMGVHQKEARWIEILGSQEYETSRMWADAWCAAFVWRKVDDPALPYPITEQDFRKIEQNPKFVDSRIRAEIRRLAEQYQFFHWHLAFPSVFEAAVGEKVSENIATGWNSGFDIVLGNPPWEHSELKEKEWFADRSPKIAQALTAALRKRMIRELAKEEPALFGEFELALRAYDASNHLIRCSGRFLLTAKGRINSYALFSDLSSSLISSSGRAGCIVPSGIATDHTTRHFFDDLVSSERLVAFYGFENEGKLFPAVDHRVNFSILLMAGKSLGRPAEFAAFLRHPDFLRDPERSFKLTAAEIQLINPNTRTCPVFRTRRDAELTKSLYRRIPVLIREGSPDLNPWGIDFRQGVFNMASDSQLFCTREQLEEEGWELFRNQFSRGNEFCLPLYEAKMIHLFDHRFGDFSRINPGSSSHILPEVPQKDHENPEYFPLPRYWVNRSEVETRLARRWHSSWLLGWRDVTDARSSVRTVISSVIPRAACGDTFLLMFPEADGPLWALTAILSAFVLDYVARQKIGGVHLKYHVFKQLPVITPDALNTVSPWAKPLTYSKWLLYHVLELTYTAWDLQPFAQDHGYDGPPFRWDEGRRFLLRCELDAAFFHLYGIGRDDVDYIMETFPIVKRKDVKKHGDYRTKLQILDIYDAMQRAIDTGEPYQTLLDPPPADPRVAHPPREDEARPSATVLPFPSVPPPEIERYPAPEPRLSEVAELASTYDADPAPSSPSAEGILAWLGTQPGWHARSDILADLDLSTGDWNVAIRQLVDSGQVEKKGEKRGTRYRLTGPDPDAADDQDDDLSSADASVSAGETPADRIHAWLAERPGWHARGDILADLDDISGGDWNQAIRELVTFGEVERKGEKRGARYRAVGGSE